MNIGKALANCHTELQAYLLTLISQSVISCNRCSQLSTIELIVGIGMSMTI